MQYIGCSNCDKSYEGIKYMYSVNETSVSLVIYNLPLISNKIYKLFELTKF